MSQKRTFTTFTRMPYQDSISLVLKIIDYHNNQSMKDFSNAEFHKRQAIALKLWLIDMKEFINCLLYTSPSPRDKRQSRMPSSA